MPRIRQRQQQHVLDPTISHGSSPSRANGHTQNVFSISTVNWAKKLADMANPNQTGNDDQVRLTLGDVGVGRVYEPSGLMGASSPSSGFGSAPT